MDDDIIELPSPMGGVMWKGHLSGIDDTGDSLRINTGYSAMPAWVLLESSRGQGWTRGLSACW